MSGTVTYTKEQLERACVEILGEQTVSLFGRRLVRCVNEAAFKAFMNRTDSKATDIVRQAMIDLNTTGKFQFISFETQ